MKKNEPLYFIILKDKICEGAISSINIYMENDNKLERKSYTLEDFNFWIVKEYYGNKKHYIKENFKFNFSPNKMICRAGFNTMNNENVLKDFQRVLIPLKYDPKSNTKFMVSITFFDPIRETYTVDYTDIIGLSDGYGDLELSISQKQESFSTDFEIEILKELKEINKKLSNGSELIKELFYIKRNLYDMERTIDDIKNKMH